MKRLLILSTATILIFTSVTLSSPPNGNPDQILAKMQEAAKKITTIRASIEQMKKYDIGGKPETYRGILIFKHAGKSDWLRINYDNTQQVSVDPSKIVLYQPKINQAIVTTRGQLAAKNQEFAFFSAPYSLTGAQMKQRYDIVHTGDEQVGGVNTSVLQLTPKQQSAVRQMKWWVSQASWLPVKSEMIDSRSGDITTFTMGNMEINPKIADSEFKIKFAPGTKIVNK
ncbi:MAG TPA: sigma-E factor regulatory protein RseB domain-containing protein [Blastocatellia bacterium]|jgi:outer membrane lipoprotein-sorting protein